MFKRLLPALVSSTMWLASTAFAADTSNPSIVLLTENFPPYNMAKNGKNFAQNDNIEGIAVDILRETFKRADISYSMTLRFPWERIYHLALENPGYGVFVTARVPEREKLFKWVGPIGPDDWVLLARGDSPITLTSLEQARQLSGWALTKATPLPESLDKQGLKPVVALRDQDNAQKLQAGQIDLWATGDPAGQLPGAAGGDERAQDGVALSSVPQLYLALNKDVPDELVSQVAEGAGSAKG
jgi:polar amino acid transport system substrate-binding protein